jgi:hypothetical protein
MKKLLMLAIVSILSLTGFSQNDQGKTKNEKSDQATTIKYTCPMHAEVISDKAGKCPKCGMNLIVKKSETKKSFSCPMHAEVISDKAGKCPKCGMNLVEKKTK